MDFDQFWKRSQLTEGIWDDLVNAGRDYIQGPAKQQNKTATEEAVRKAKANRTNPRNLLKDNSIVTDLTMAYTKRLAGKMGVTLSGSFPVEAAKTITQKMLHGRRDQEDSVINRHEIEEILSWFATQTPAAKSVGRNLITPFNVLDLFPWDEVKKLTNDKGENYWARPNDGRHPEGWFIHPEVVKFQNYVSKHGYEYYQKVKERKRELSDEEHKSALRKAQIERRLAKSKFKAEDAENKRKASIAGLQGQIISHDTGAKDLLLAFKLIDDQLTAGLPVGGMVDIKFAVNDPAQLSYLVKYLTKIAVEAGVPNP